jgi:V/A-type H+-transporting ATPase subunit A
LVKQGVPISLIKGSDAVEDITHLREFAADDKSSFERARKKLDNHLNRVGVERTREGGGAK